jgi:hypothetical protein
MSVLLCVLLSLRTWARSRAALQLEVLALRHQLQVLQRTRPRRLRLAKTDRWLWGQLSCIWPGWRTALVIVKPETVIAWNRRGFRLWWAWKSRRHMDGVCRRTQRTDCARGVQITRGNALMDDQMDFLVGTPTIIVSGFRTSRISGVSRKRTATIASRAALIMAQVLCETGHLPEGRASNDRGSMNLDPTGIVRNRVTEAAVTRTRGKGRPGLRSEARCRILPP